MVAIMEMFEKIFTNFGLTAVADIFAQIKVALEKLLNKEGE